MVRRMQLSECLIVVIMQFLCSNETVLILLIMQYCGTTNCNELLQYVFQYMMDGMGIGVAP